MAGTMGPGTNLVPNFGKTQKGGGHFWEDGTALDLSEETSTLMENISANLQSLGLRNENYSGTPQAGTVRIPRYKNSKVKAYGTARAAGHGVGLTKREETVIVNIQEEIIEEFENDDLRLGVDDFKKVVNSRAVNHGQTYAIRLDKKFFRDFSAACTSVTPVGDDIVDQIESIIQELEKTENDYIEGIDRSMLQIVLDSKPFAVLKRHMEEMPNDTNANDIKDNAVGMFRGVRVYRTTRLDAAEQNNVFVAIEGMVAQPFFLTQYSFSRIPQSNASSLDSFLTHGQGVVEPGLGRKYKYTPKTV